MRDGTQQTKRETNQSKELRVLPMSNNYCSERTSEEREKRIMLSDEIQNIETSLKRTQNAKQNKEKAIKISNKRNAQHTQLKQTSKNENQMNFGEFTGKI